MDLGEKTYILNAQGEEVDCAPEELASTVLSPNENAMEVAIDGSCTKPPIKEFQRAGWSLTTLDPHSSTPLSSMHAAVPASLPQTSAMGEHLGGAYVSQIADRVVTVHVDFTGVIKLRSKGLTQQLTSKTPYACVAHFAQSMDGSKFVSRFLHMEAHRSRTTRA